MIRESTLRSPTPWIYEVKVEKAATTGSLGVLLSPDAKQSDVRTRSRRHQRTVTVTAATGQLLKTDRADVATTFETRQVTDLPILDRNFTKLILLTPGSQQLQWQHAASENPQGSTQIMVNGQHFSGTGYQLDGTENRDPILGIIVTTEIRGDWRNQDHRRIIDAQFGQAIRRKAGRCRPNGHQRIHGASSSSGRKDGLQARNPFTQFQKDPLTGQFIPGSLKNQFGGSIGGPIIKDKFFYFGDYQGTRSKIGGSRLLTVPTVAARTGDLSGYGVNIFDPQSGLQFPGNIITLPNTQPGISCTIHTPNAPGTTWHRTLFGLGQRLFNADTSISSTVDSHHVNLFGNIVSPTSRGMVHKLSAGCRPALGALAALEFVSTVCQ